MTPLRRIGILTTGFPRFEGDFAGSFVFHMANALANRGYQIEVVAPAFPLDSLPVGALNLNREWLSVHRVNYMIPNCWQTLCYGDGIPENLATAPRKAALALPLALQMWNKVEQLAPCWSAVVSHWLLPSALIAPRVPAFSIPHLAIAHSGDIHLLSRLPLRKVIVGAVLRRCSAINFVTTQLKTEFEQLIPPHRRDRLLPLSVLPMGIAPSTCHRSRVEIRQSLGFKGFTVLYLGRLCPIKGVRYLLEAMAHCDAQLVIAGDGVERLQLEKLAEKYALHVTFLGAVGPQLRDELLTACDVLVLPSVSLENGRHEGAPTVIREAMQAGLPVIATRSGGIPELISDGETGLLVPERDAHAIREAIKIIQKNPELSTSFRRKAKNQSRTFRWDFLSCKYEELLFNR